MSRTTSADTSSIQGHFGAPFIESSYSHRGNMTYKIHESSDIKLKLQNTLNKLGKEFYIEGILVRLSVASPKDAAYGMMRALALLSDHAKGQGRHFNAVKVTRTSAHAVKTQLERVAPDEPTTEVKTDGEAVAEALEQEKALLLEISTLREQAVRTEKLVKSYEQRIGELTSILKELNGEGDRRMMAENAVKDLDREARQLREDMKAAEESYSKTFEEMRQQHRTDKLTIASLGEAYKEASKELDMMKLDYGSCIHAKAKAEALERQNAVLFSALELAHTVIDTQSKYIEEHTED